jgi:hypothetical protein
MEDNIMSFFEEIKIADAITGVTARVDDGGALAVIPEDPHTRALDLRFLRALSVPAEILNGSIAVDSNTWLLDNTTDAVVGLIVLVVNMDGTFNRGRVVSINAGVSIVVDTPADTPMVESGSSVIYTTDEMAVAGGSIGAPLVYQIAGVGSATGINIDLTRIMGAMESATGMDDSMFGNIAGGLTNGIVLRHNNSEIVNLWPAQHTNGDIALACYDAIYPLKQPAGVFAFRFRCTYGGASKHGVVIRLEPEDTLELLVQDDLSNITSFKMMAQGHLAEHV